MQALSNEHVVTCSNIRQHVMTITSDSTLHIGGSSSGYEVGAVDGVHRARLACAQGLLPPCFLR